ncbi:hypothetical protein [Dyadobacter tibetensis]|uniref:hypothetical protein n=1 Tax=Dyadobacter tibetensis TaxID=1211851 RepID=UPI0010E8B712|nr:hypothetical protein [Dyadobacter tibetensis]
MKFTIIPYVLDLVFTEIKSLIIKQQYIPMETVDPQFMDYGSGVKTAESYENNLSEICQLAKEKKEQLLLVEYAPYFPAGQNLTGREEDKQAFANCYGMSPVTTWGRPENVQKAIDIHNEILLKVSKKEQIPYLDMSKKLPKHKVMYCDVCHLSEIGAQVFYKELACYILEKNLLSLVRKPLDSKAELIESGFFE